MMLDVLDENALKPVEIDLREKLEALGAHFQSAVTPEKGCFGVTEVDKGNGFVEVTGKTAEGHTYREYLRDGEIYKRRVNLGKHEWEVYDYDDNGIQYLKTTQVLDKSGVNMKSMELAPDVTITKGNFTAQTDRFGRPVHNKIEDLQLREGSRQSLSPDLRDASYIEGDHRGHIISDQFGGPASKENVIAQLDKVNTGKMREIERTVEKLKKDGHQVDYSVKTNYTGSDTRPSSFEASIVVDGEPFELPKDLKKIYNSDINDAALPSAAKRAVTSIGERYGLAHEEGLGSAKVAAAITCSVSTYENVSSFIDGEIDAEKMVENVVGDTLSAGGIAYGTTFVTESVSQAMRASSNQLIGSVGGSCAPALVVSFGVESYSDISDFAQGKIDAQELAYDLGQNAAEVGGGAVGGAIVGAKVGAVAGMVAGPAGAAVGGVAGSVIGGVVGCAVASEAYASAVELGSEGAEIIGEQVESLANNTIDAVREAVPEQISNVRDAFNGFFQDNNLPFSV